MAKVLGIGENNNTVIVDQQFGFRFYLGQILFFESKNAFDNFNQKFNFVLGVDYDIVDQDGRFLRFGEDYSIGGDNYIIEDNIRKISKRIVTNNVSTYTSRFNTDSIQGYCSRGAGNATNFTNISNFMSEFVEIGSDSPQEFLPKFKRIFAIRFLKDL